MRKIFHSYGLALLSLGACHKPRPRPIEDVIAIPAGTFRLQQATCPPDLEHVDPAWVAQKLQEAHDDAPATVGAFEIERRPVTRKDYNDCVDAGVCDSSDERSDIDRTDHPEPGVSLSFDNAERLCAWRGGRLPTLGELQRALRGARDEGMLDRGQSRGTFEETTSPDGLVFFVEGYGGSRHEWTSSIGCGFKHPVVAEGKLFRSHAVQDLGVGDLRWVSYFPDRAAAFRCARK